MCNAADGGSWHSHEKSKVLPRKTPLFFSTFLHAVQTSSSCAFSRVCIYKTVFKLEFPLANIHFFHLVHRLAIAEFMNGFKILSEFLREIFA